MNKRLSNLDSATVEVHAPVSRVTVLEDRAQVSRRLSAELPAGRSTLRINGVTPVLSDRSLAAALRSGTSVSITDVRTRRQLRPETGPQRGRSPAADRLHERLAHRHDLRRLARTTAEQLKVVDQIATQTLADLATDVAWGTVAPELWSDSLTEAADHEQRLHEGALDLDQKLELLDEEIDDLRRRVAAEARPDRPMAASIEVDLEATDSGPVELELSYLVPSACWRPAHRAVLSDADGGQELHFETQACVWQNTGEDWNQVELSFSTQRPSLGTEAPLLADDVLSARGRPEQVTIALRDQEIQTTGEGAARSRGQGLPGVDDGGSVVAFRAERPVSVPSDGRPYRSRVMHFRSAAESENVLMAELAPAVVHKVSLANRGRLPILAGPVDLVRGNELVGRTSVLFVAPGENFAIGFGPRPELRIRRRVERVELESGALSRHVQTEHSVRLLMSNISTGTVDFDAIERLPISEVEQVKVNFDDQCSTSGAVPDEHGFVTWRVQLDGGSTRRLDLRYTVAKRKNVEGV